MGSINSFSTSDTNAPTVSITSPTQGSTVSGASVSLSAIASGDIGISGVQFKLDGVTNIGSEILSAPYTLTWDTTAITTYGSHTIYAIARDSSGKQATSTVTVNVDNVAPTILSAVHDSDTQITVTLSKSANPATITKSNDGGFSVAKTGSSGTTFAVASISPGSDNTKVVLTVSDLSSAGGSGITVSYSASGNGTVSDSLGNVLATYSSGISIPPWNTAAPIISSVTTSKPDGAYSAGTDIDLAFNFSKPVTSTGSVAVSLNSGGSCTFSVSASSSASCTYTIVGGQNADPLNISSITGAIVSTDSNAMTNFSPALNLSDSKSIIVDTVAPTVSLDAPTNGSNISGNNITLSATAAHAGVPVAGVKFILDGNVALGTEIASAPYSLVWDFTYVSAGAHTISAVARDGAGNYATSTNSVIVSAVTAPVVLSSVATDISTSSIVLNASIVNNGESSSTIRGFGYGLTTSYGSQSSENGTFDIGHYSQMVTGLDCSATYHFQAFAANGSGTGSSTDTTFSTLPCSDRSVIVLNSQSGSISYQSTSSVDAVTLSVPSSAVGVDAVFEITGQDPVATVSQYSKPSVSLLPAALRAYRLAATQYIDAASISSFGRPITLMISYSLTEITGIDETTLAIYRYDGSSWHRLDSCAVDTSVHSVTCTTNNFSTFMVFGGAAASTAQNPPNNTVYYPPVSSGGGGGGGGSGASYSVFNLSQFNSANGTSTATSSAPITSAVPGCPIGYTCVPVKTETSQNDESGPHIEAPGSDESGSQTADTSKRYQFARTLRVGAIGADVKQLQRFLNSHGFRLASKGPGSPGHETTIFGPLLKAALGRFQSANKEIVLVPQGLSKPTGFFGQATKDLVNEMLMDE